MFDYVGTLLFENNAVNATQTKLTAGQNNEVLLVQITVADGVVVTKKAIR